MGFKEAGKNKYVLDVSCGSSFFVALLGACFTHAFAGGQERLVKLVQ